MAAKPKRQRKPGKVKKQSERFIETARKHEADESGKSFERAFDLVVPAKRSSQFKKSG